MDRENVGESSDQSFLAPKYTLRGHGAAIHALQVFAQNLRLVSGDADGWVVIWDMVTKRPVVSWKAHQGAILEVKAFQFGAVTEIYTHGKDHKLCVWAFHLNYELSLSKVLPLDAHKDHRDGNLPLLVYSLPVNALNFCAFSLLFLLDWAESAPLRPNGSQINNPQSSHSPAGSDTSEQVGEAKQEAEYKNRDKSEGLQQSEDRQTSRSEEVAPSPSHEDLVKTGLHSLIAVPNTLNSGAIDVYHLPSKRRLSTIYPGINSETGMVMSVSLFVSAHDELYAASAYEDGHAMLFVCREKFRDQATIQNNPTFWKWDRLYCHKSHKQPALSIAISPSKDYFLSTAADSVLAKHPIPSPSPPTSVLPDAVAGYSPLDAQKVGSAGQQSIRIRSDGYFCAAACWNDTVKMYACSTLKVMKTISWHKDGCHAIALGRVDENRSSSAESPAGNRRPGSNVSLAVANRLRQVNVRDTHWLITGSKQGRIGLWDVY